MSDYPAFAKCKELDRPAAEGLAYLFYTATLSTASKTIGESRKVISAGLD